MVGRHPQWDSGGLKFLLVGQAGLGDTPRGPAGVVSPFWKARRGREALAEDQEAHG